MAWLFFAITWAGLCISVSASVVRRDTATQWKVAVYEHPVRNGSSRDSPITGVLSRKQALEIIALNLNDFEYQSRLAVQQGAKMIVFPEYAIWIYGFNNTRDTIYPILEVAADPQLDTTNPCQDFPTSNLTSDRYIQYRTSCLARNLLLFIVINAGTKQPCLRNEDENCPEDGRYQFNTNLVFAPDGQLVARYRKKNLFGEHHFDEPPTAEVITFDTPIGKFGTIVCFDVLFAEPALSLIEKKHVKHIAFSTAWTTTLPFMYSLGFHSSFARRFGINLLSSELHLPEEKLTGSAIYPGNSDTKEYFVSGRLLGRNPSDTRKGKLLVTTIEADAKRPERTNIKIPKVNVSRNVSKITIHNNEYWLLPLRNANGRLLIEHGDTSCFLEYHGLQLAAGEGFGLAVSETLHGSARNSSIQVCTVIKCNNASILSTCGHRYTVYSKSRISNLTLIGQFSTKYVFPQVIGHNLSLYEHWNFKMNEADFRFRIDASSLDNPPLLHATLYGRKYEWDDGKPDTHMTTTGSPRKPAIISGGSTFGPIIDEHTLLTCCFLVLPIVQIITSRDH